MSDGNGALPEGWEWAKLGELGAFINGDRGKNYPNKSALVAEGIPFINAGHLEGGRIDFATMGYINEERFNLLGSGKVQPDDILYCLRGSLGKTAIVKDIDRGAIASSLVIIRPSSDANTEYLFNFLVSPLGQDRIAAYDNGSAQPNLSSKSVRDYDVPLPPLAEQRRIVSKIESLQERSSRARRALSEVGPLLEQFRQSVLRAAFSGRLTADWRAANPDVEPATELLTRIRTERRHRWEQSELAKYEAKAKQPPKNWQDKYKEPEPVGEVELDELQPVVIGKPKTAAPNGWVWASLVDVAKLESGHTPRKSVPEYWEGGDVPWISLRDIRAAHGKIITDTDKMPTMLGIENSSSRLLPAGTVCFSRDISVGFTTIMGREMATTQHFANWICGELISNEFLMYAFMTARHSLIRAGEGTTVRTIYMPALNRLHVLLPTRAEQDEIVRRIKSQRAAIAVVESSLAGMESSLTQLDQSILGKAFRGELVPQDPRDEPASKLLARIRTTREATAAKTKTNTPKRRAKKR